MKRRLSLKAAQFPLSAPFERIHSLLNKARPSVDSGDESVSRFSGSNEEQRDQKPSKKQSIEFFQVQDISSPILD